MATALIGIWSLAGLIYGVANLVDDVAERGGANPGGDFGLGPFLLMVAAWSLGLCLAVFGTGIAVAVIVRNRTLPNWRALALVVLITGAATGQLASGYIGADDGIVRDGIFVAAAVAAVLGAATLLGVLRRGGSATPRPPGPQGDTPPRGFLR